MEGPVRKSKIWFFSFEALNAEKKGVRGVCAGINYDYWSGKIRKKWRKKRALVPSDEGRVRKSSSVYTMFAIGDASGAGYTYFWHPKMEEEYCDWIRMFPKLWHGFSMISSQILHANFNARTLEIPRTIWKGHWKVGKNVAKSIFLIFCSPIFLSFVPKIHAKSTLVNFLDDIFSAAPPLPSPSLSPLPSPSLPRGCFNN